MGEELKETWRLRASSVKVLVDKRRGEKRERRKWEEMKQG